MTTVKPDVGYTRMKIYSTIAFVLLSACQCFAATSIVYKASVTNVVDGDTIQTDSLRRVDEEMRPILEPVYLDSIDAPELDQPGGKEARQFLEKLLLGKEVWIVEVLDGQKSHGAWVTLQGDLVNVAIVQNGHAWWVDTKPEYRSGDTRVTLSMAQAWAEERKLGLWQQKDPIPPAEWRKKKKEEANKNLGPTNQGAP